MCKITPPLTVYNHSLCELENNGNFNCLIVISLIFSVLFSAIRSFIVGGILSKILCKTKLCPSIFNIFLPEPASNNVVYIRKLRRW